MNSSIKACGLIPKTFLMSIRFWKIEISPVFIAVIAFFSIVDNIKYTAILLAAALSHEAAHLLAGYFCGLKLEKIKFMAYGIKIVFKGFEKASYNSEFFIAIAGPVMNILIALGVYFQIRIFGYFNGAGFFLLANISLAAVNLLPIMNLDGGRAFKCLVSKKYDPFRAERICELVSLAFLFPLAVLSIFALFYSGFNISLVLILFYLLLLIFVKTKNRGYMPA